MKNKILIADDHYVVRSGVNIIIESGIEETYINIADDYFEVIEKLKQEQFDLIILDINMNGSKNILMISEIKAIQPNIKILIFSASDEKIGLQYIVEGANGYLNKLCTEDQILLGVKTILETGKFYPEKLLLSLMETITKKETITISPEKELSKREYEIYRLLIQGYGSLEISNNLKIHTSTVSTLKKRIFNKLKVNNIAELINIRVSLKNQ